MKSPSLLLLCALCSSAGALTCLSCTDPLCSNTHSVTCSSETRCMLAGVRATEAGVASSQNVMGCASAALCPYSGFHTLSANFRDNGVVATVMCCSLDDCNLGTLAFLGAQNPNGHECFSCNGAQCDSVLQCSGQADRCFRADLTSGSGATSPLLGCASRKLCTAAAALGKMPFMTQMGNISASSCCTGNLCNPLKSTTDTTTTKPTTTTTADAGGRVTRGPCTHRPASGACCGRLALIHLLLGLLLFTLW